MYESFGILNFVIIVRLVTHYYKINILKTNWLWNAKKEKNRRIQMHTFYKRNDPKHSALDMQLWVQYNFKNLSALQLKLSIKFLQSFIRNIVTKMFYFIQMEVKRNVNGKMAKIGGYFAMYFCQINLIFF